MKYSGIIGYWEEDVEITPDVYRPKIVERKAYGDVLENRRSFQATSDSQNDKFTVNNKLSIVSDLYMREHWPSIRYAVWNGVKWKVTNVDVGYPRITLTIGGTWNENEG